MKSSAPQPSDPPVATLIPFAVVAALIGRPPDRAARLWLWRSARNGAFCAPVRLGGTLRWRRAEVLAHLENLRHVSYAATSTSSTK